LIRGGHEKNLRPGSEHIVCICINRAIVSSADKSKTYYVCNCQDDCKCNFVANNPGKCNCGANLAAMHVLAIEKGLEYFAVAARTAAVSAARAIPASAVVGSR